MVNIDARPTPFAMLGWTFGSIRVIYAMSVFIIPAPCAQQCGRVPANLQGGLRLQCHSAMVGGRYGFSASFKNTLTKLAYWPNDPKAIPLPPWQVILRAWIFVEFCVDLGQMCKQAYWRSRNHTPLMARQSSPQVTSQFRRVTLSLRYVLMPLHKSARNPSCQ
jgi:hypothetical protein